MEFYIYIYVSENDNNYYNYRKSSRAAITSATMTFSQSKDSRCLWDLHLSLSQPFTAGTQMHRALHGSLVAIYIPPPLTIGQTHRVSSSSSVFFFFSKIYIRWLLRLSTKNGKTLSRPINGINFFLLARIYSIITFSKQYFVYSLGNSEDPHMIHLNYLIFSRLFFFNFFPLSLNRVKHWDVIAHYLH